MTAKAKVTQMKAVTLKDLKPKQYKLYLEVPGHPEIKDVYLDIVGIESKEYAVTAAQLFKDRGAATDKDLTVDEALEESAKLASSLIKGWGTTEFFGTEYTPEEALAVMSDFDNKWIRQQLEAASAERAHFLAR